MDTFCLGELRGSDSMKQFFRIICCAVLTGMVLLGNMAFAASAPIERLTPDSPDYAELTALTDRILDEINQLQVYDDSGIDSDAAASDIHWNQAYKIYVDESDVYASFAEHAMTYDALQQAMDYTVWVLPVQIDDAHLCITISKGLPLAEDDPAREVLTDEQVRQLEADAGKWRPAAIEELDYDKTAEWYEQKLTAAYGESVQRAFIMGGSPKLRSAVGIVEAGDDSIQVVILEEPRLVGQLSVTHGRTSVQQPENGTAYSMKDMTAMMQSYILPTDDEQTGTGGIDTVSDGTGSGSVIVAILCAAALMMLASGMIRRNR